MIIPGRLHENGGEKIHRINEGRCELGKQVGKRIDEILKASLILISRKINTNSRTYSVIDSVEEFHDNLFVSSPREFELFGLVGSMKYSPLSITCLAVCRTLGISIEAWLVLVTIEFPSDNTKEHKYSETENDVCNVKKKKRKNKAIKTFPSHKSPFLT